MTIAVAVQVHDGVVLASDSATTLTDPSKAGPENIVNVYNNANKIFNLRKGLPIGAVTYGMGGIGQSSISTLAKDLRRRFTGEEKAHAAWKLDPETFTVEGVAQKAREFLYDEKYKPLAIKAQGTGVHFGFIVAGLSGGSQLSEVWAVEIKNGNCAQPTCILKQGDVGSYAAGEPEAVSRIVNGYGTKLRDALLKLGVDETKIDAAMLLVQQELFVPLVEAPMPIQDTIDFAEYLVHTTSKFTKFKRGAATVGGPVESAAITKHEGFKWVKRKHYFDATFNPRVITQ